MAQLSLYRWILLFFAYCFVGWVWECCLCSFTQKHWVNRGFLYGPWLPIYGSGAIIILVSTLRFTDYPVAVFFVGMIFATTLEYFTGAAMEKMFHMRYWDYSDCFLNLNGHICFKATLCWGVFSILLVYFVNLPFLSFVNAVPDAYIITIVSILCVLFFIDYWFSVKAAMRLRKLMDKIAAESKLVRSIQAKIDELEEYADEKNEEYLARIRALQAEFKQRQQEAKEGFIDSALYQNVLKAKVAEIKASQDWMLAQTENMLLQLEVMSEKADSLKDAAKEEFSTGIQAVKDSLSSVTKAYNTHTDMDYEELVKFLNKYPTAKSTVNPESLKFMKIQAKRKNK